MSNAQESPAPFPRSSFWAGACLAGLVVMLVYVWFLTHGSWNLWAPENFGQFYDYQALSFAHGKLDVPPKAIEFEAFVVEGRSYGYWGPFPALLRLPLALFGEGAWVGHTARLSCLVAALLTFAGTLGIFEELARYFSQPITRRFFPLFFFGAFALGSPTLFLVSHSFIYHEVILWAAALAVGGFWFLLRFVNDANPRDLYWAIGCGIASALTRPTFGYGLLCSAALVALHHGWRHRTSLKRSFLPLVAALCFLGLAAPLAYNFVRFHSIDPPYKNHMLYDAARLARTNGGHMFQPTNLPGVLSTYLSFRHVDVSRQFPYFRLLYADTTGLVIDGWEPHAGLGATMAGALVVAAIGLGYGLRRPLLWLLFAGAAAGIVLTCSFAGIQERYLQDFLPFLALATGCGVLAFDSFAGWAGRFGRGLIVVLMLLSIFEYYSLAITYQRTSAFTPSTDEKTAFEKSSLGIDHALRRTYARFVGVPLTIATVDNWDNLPAPRPGLIAKRDTPFGLLWYDGLQWVPLAGDCDDILHLQMEVTHSTAHPGSVSEPIVVTGPKDSPNILFLESYGQGNYRVGCEIWGREMKEGALFQCPSDVVRLEVVVDRVNSVIRAVFEKQIVFETHGRPYPVKKSEMLLGLNPMGGSFANKACLPGTQIRVISQY